MGSRSVWLLVFLVSLVVGTEHQTCTKTNSIAILTPTLINPYSPASRGKVTFETFGEDPQHVFLKMEISGLRHGDCYSVHIHESGDVSDAFRGMGTGSPWNITETEREFENLRTGDLGVWCADVVGNILTRKTIKKRLSLADRDRQFIIGRSVVVHAGEGADSPRWLQGTIGYERGSCAFYTERKEIPSTTSACFVRSAIAAIFPSRKSLVFGKVKFFQERQSAVKVHVMINGLKRNSKHAIHVHEFGDISDRIGLATGDDFDPHNTDKHGCPGYEDQDNHAGDLGNWRTDNWGTIDEVRTFEKFDLLNFNRTSTETSVLGRSVVIYAREDDCLDEDSGGRVVAQGVIGRTSEQHHREARN